jgi:hypothetical protein
VSLDADIIFHVPSCFVLRLTVAQALFVVA